MLLISAPQRVHGERLSVAFDQNQANATVTNALPVITNGYPGMRLPTETIKVTNKGAQAILVQLTVNNSATLSGYVEGVLAINGPNKTTIYSLADGLKGISMQMASKETVTVEAQLALSGELMGNETQDISYGIRYCFTANEAVSQSSNQTEATKVGKRNQVTFPKTNERTSVGSLLGYFLVSLVLLLKRKNH